MLTNLLVMPLVGPIVCLGLICAVTGLVPAFSHITRAVMLLAALLVKSLQNTIVFYTSSLPAAQLVLPKAFTVFAVLVCGQSFGMPGKSAACAGRFRFYAWDWGCPLGFSISWGRM